MKPKPTELTTALTHSLEVYQQLLADNELKRQLLVDMTAKVDAINLEIENTLKTVDKPEYPTFQTIEEIDQFIANNKSPRQRLDMLESVKKNLDSQLIAAQLNYQRGIDTQIAMKRDTWGELARVLFQPIKEDFGTLIVALGYAGLDLLPFALANTQDCRSGIADELITKYGMPK